jgi:hypothetical protein
VQNGDSEVIGPVTTDLLSDCRSIWLFEATTGDMVALGGDCNLSIGCTGVGYDFQYPSACIPGNMAGPQQLLCPWNAGSTGHASVESGSDSGADALMLDAKSD